MDGSKAFTALVQQRALTVASIRLVQNIKETAVYNQVRTVVWEDGAARPLLPDRICFGGHRLVATLGLPPLAVIICVRSWTAVSMGWTSAMVMGVFPVAST